MKAPRSKGNLPGSAVAPSSSHCDPTTSAGILRASGKGAACRPAFFAVLVFVLLSGSAMAGITVFSDLDGGGHSTTSSLYSMSGSLNSLSGISTAASPSVTMRQGYIGQLYNVTSLTVTAVPLVVDEMGASQLSATANLDDDTVLVLNGSNVSWMAGFPIASINAGGLATAASVYTFASGSVSGYYLGASDSVSLLVVNPNDGIPISWEIEYFGTNNPEGVASADADGTGQDNLLKYLAGLDPTNSASILRITAVNKQGNDIDVTWTCEGGHSYVLQSTKSAAIGGYTTNFADISPVITVPGVGATATNYVDSGAAYAPVLAGPGGTLMTTSVVASTVNCSADTTRGLTDSLGKPSPMGSLLMLGTFSISESAIQSNFSSGNVSAIMSNFTPYGTAFAVGDGTGLPASWNVSQSAAGFGGLQIYLLAIDTSAFGTANDLGIYTAPSWIFPADGSQTSINLADVTDFVLGAQGSPLTIGLPLGGDTYTFNDSARLYILPGRILYYRVRLGP